MPEYLKRFLRRIRLQVQRFGNRGSPTPVFSTPPLSPSPAFRNFIKLFNLAAFFGILPYKYNSKTNSFETSIGLKLRSLLVLLYLTSIYIPIPLGNTFTNTWIAEKYRCPTDRFAYNSSSLISTLWIYVYLVITIWKVKSLVRIVSLMGIYDSVYKPHCTRRSLFGWHSIVTLIISSLDLCVTPVIIFNDLLRIVDSGHYWVAVVRFLCFGRSHVAIVLFILSIGILELSHAFNITTLAFLVHTLKDRIQELGTTRGARREDAEKFKMLREIGKELHSFSGPFILVAILGSYIMLVGNSHLVLFIAISVGGYSSKEVSSGGLLEEQIRMYGVLCATLVGVILVSLQPAILVDLGQQLIDVDQAFKETLRYGNTVTLACLSKRWKFELSACGFFTLRRGMVIEMVASMVALLIVLIQFRYDENCVNSFVKAGQ